MLSEKLSKPMYYQTVAFKIKTCLCTQHSNFEEINHTWG